MNTKRELKLTITKNNTVELVSTEQDGVYEDQFKFKDITKTELKSLLRVLPAVIRVLESDKSEDYIGYSFLIN